MTATRSSDGTVPVRTVSTARPDSAEFPRIALHRNPHWTRRVRLHIDIGRVRRDDHLGKHQATVCGQSSGRGE